MKTLTTILYSFAYLASFSQTDTIRVDLEDLSLDYKTCECLLFGGCRSYSYPIKKDWKRADSLFIGNRDTIYFVLMDRGFIKMEGLKRPEGESLGKVIFYNEYPEIRKVEYWEEVFLDLENESASWSDGYYWAKQLIYKNGMLVKEFNRSLVYDEKKGFGQKTSTSYIRDGKITRTKSKTRFF